MAATANAPVIIKRKKVIEADGHHGGAWKVAYADFVTAMMAFFMLMWLLNATTEQQRKGISDYFSPSIPLARVSGGGDGAMGGTNPTPDSRMEYDGQGAAPFREGRPVGFKTDNPAEVAALNDLEQTLLGKGGESLVSDNAMRHVITRVTDEGLVVELFDIDKAHLFTPGTSQPTDLGKELAVMLSEVFTMVDNDIAIAAHVRSWPSVMVEDRAWPLSMERSDIFRRLLEGAGFDDDRIQRVTGHGDRKLASDHPVSTRNNRIEITLLRDGN